jgi:light-regulated signal transduction histidine kinase (bacteriophytochrome)
VEELEQGLRQKEAELAQAKAEFEQFLYAASHDLQEPLRMISGYANLLSKRYGNLLPPEGQEFVNFITDGAARMTRLIQDLVSYSRAGSTEIQKRPVNMMAIFQWVAMNLSADIRAAGAQVTADPLPEVEGDESQLVMMLQHLISNAIKFRGSEPLKVHVAVRELDDAYEFCVVDNGQGFAPEYAERVFAVFKRLHGRDYPGNGIGLAIVRRIVERHGGKTWASAEPGKGARFFFTLPR